jgi:hypothetical protein
MGSEPGQVPFEAHVELLRHFLVHRAGIVESIEAILNAQRKPDLQDLARQFEDCFFASTSQAHLRGQLEAAHFASGFKPREVHHLYNDLIHPAEMLTRGVHCWQQTWWPGRGARMHYAHTLFNLYVLRCLQFLSLRVFDESGRLGELQSVLDEMWRNSPANQPAFVRDARWLVPLAQSLITDELTLYFEVAQQVRETLRDVDALEIQKAHVRMLGGHLTSQIRYYSTKDGVSINDPGVVLRTRTTNALDAALLVQGLVALLKAYERAVHAADERMRFNMAGAICQGLSSDPELFLHRVDLLSAYSRIEYLCTSPLGQRHQLLLEEYAVLIKRLIPSLKADLPRFKPVDGGFSPYGVIFGLPSSLIEHMALKAIQSDAETRFSLEDVFDDEANPAKLAWVNSWRNLPHISREVQQLYDYPQQFAEDIYTRIEHELERRDDPRTGRLHIVSSDDTKESAIQELPAQYFASLDKTQLLRERQEGIFLVSYETPDGWIALKKELLTEVLGAGRDVRIAGLPPEAAQVLRLMCADLVLTGCRVDR